MKLALAAVPLLALAACAHQASKPPEAAAAPAAPVAEARPAPAAAPASCAADSDCAAAELCLQSRCTAITRDLAACGLTRVHFDFDQAILRPGELPLLQRAARCVKADQSVHFIVAGNADERGTVEYNLALGDRRASAVERYLVGLGVSGAQLKTVSYGKERPLCTEHDEACWAVNRRAAVRTAEAGDR